jgi:hypothetical protein
LRGGRLDHEINCGGLYFDTNGGRFVCVIVGVALQPTFNTPASACRR